MLDSTDLALARAGFDEVYDRTAAPRRRAADLEVLRARRQERRARHSRELSELLSERADLRGVYAPADLVAEALSWSA